MRDDLNTHGNLLAGANLTLFDHYIVALGPESYTTHGFVTRNCLGKWLKLFSAKLAVKTCASVVVDGLVTLQPSGCRRREAVVNNAVARVPGQFFGFHPVSTLRWIMTNTSGCRPWQGIRYGCNQLT